jgi:hypothetical protein
MAMQFDPCLFISKLLVVIIYVDDILIDGKSDAEINDLIKRLKHDKIVLHRKGRKDIWVLISNIQRDGNQTILLQEGLIK